MLRFHAEESRCRSNQRSWVLRVCLGLGACVVLALPAGAQNVTGTVYRDVDANAVLAPTSPAEAGVGGITVTAYNASGSVVGTGTTATDGTYTISGGSPSEEVRLELGALPSYLLAGPAGASSQTTVAFVTMPASGNATGVNFGVANPAQHCSANPNAVTNCYIQGDQSGTADVLVSFPYTASNNTPVPRDEALESQIGTTWGLAYQRSSDSLFAGSFQKRHAGYADGTSDGTGAIYRIVDPDDNTTTGVSTFLNLNTLFGSQVAGANPHPTGSDFDIDTASYGAVGKVSLGDLDISEDELTLWAVNLADRRLYEIPLGTDPASPVAPTLSSQVDRHDLFDLYDCDGDGSLDTMADVDVRPFALKVHDGLVYVGMVCSAESTAATSDLRALVFSFDPATDNFTNVLDFGPLTYARGETINGCTGGAADWNVWDDAYPNANILTVCTIFGNAELSYTQPWLTDIEFTADGTMLLGLRDRFGDMQGFNIEDPDGPAGDLATGDGYGDLLRATPSGSSWVVSTAEATDGTEFFGDDDWTDTTFTHNETSSGGLALRTGNQEILYTRMDPLDGGAVGVNDFAAGVRWKSTISGGTNDQYEIYDPDDAGTPAVFGKGNGLGDLELLCDIPPIQVGNRLWVDLDRDGIQDPGEPPLGGISVQLIDTDGSTVLDTATTAADGTYFFSNGTGTTSASSRFGLTGLNANSNLSAGSFMLRVDLTQADLAGFFPTFSNSDATTNGDARDSDGAQAGSNVEISFDTGLSGGNNHTLDFGFVPVDNPSSSMTWTKSSSIIGAIGPGQLVTYTLVGTNTGGTTASNVDIRDGLPASMTYVAQSTTVSAPTTTSYNVADDVVDAENYTGNDGVDNFDGIWMEFQDDGNVSTGNVTDNAFGGGILRLDDNPDSGGEPGIFRGIDVAGATAITLDFRRLTLGAVAAIDEVTLDVSNDNGTSWAVVQTWTGIVGFTDVLETGIDLLTPLLTLAGGPTDDTLVRWRVTNNYCCTGRAFGIDLVEINATLPGGIATFDNVPGGVNPDLAFGSPPQLVAPADGFSLDMGETITVTLQATVDDPITNTLCTNIATIDSDQSPLLAARAENDCLPASLGDLVWLDSDGDAVLDAGEVGLPNVEVTLFADDDGTPGPSGGDTNLGTTRTDANGFYLFDGLAAGDYYTQVTSGVPAGLTLTTPGASNPAPVVTLAAGDVDLDSDFPYTNQAPGSAVIGDYVWSDADNDGVQDGGEPGIGGVTVELRSAGVDGILGTGDDVVEDSATTTADGRYLFTNVTPGEYMVAVTDTANVLTGYTLTSGPQSNPDPTLPISVAADDVYLQADFGYFQAGLGTLGNQVWLDANTDGTFQSGSEAGIEGVTIDLILDANGNGSQDSGELVIATAITGPNGTYSFNGLLLDDGGGDADADYLVAITDTAAKLSDLIKVDGTNPGSDDNSQVVFYPVTLSAGTTSNTTGDFGYNSLGRLGDLVWADTNSDGVKDADELGISGVTLELYFDRDGDGVFEPGGDDGAAIDTTTTDTFGNYLFDGLAPGNWFVTIDDTQPALAGYTQTTADDEAAAGDQQQESLSAPGDSNLDADFGYVNAALANLTGNVFNNRDGDGCDDGVGEEGLVGVTVDLLDASGNVLATATTDSSGDYSFDDLPAATYTVRVSDQAGVLDDYFLTSGRDQIEIVLAGSDVTVDDLGYGRGDETGAVSGSVWLDVDPPGAGTPDGLRGPTEAGLTMVYLSLYRDVDGDGVAEPGGDDGAAIATAVVGATGRFSFEGLAAGNYFVDLDGTTLPASLTVATGTTDPSSVIALSEGERFTSANFGYRPSGVTLIVGDRLWYDSNSDGLQDPGEAGIGGVDVTYIGAGADTVLGTVDDTTATTTTAPDGTYLFTGLAADDYIVFFDAATLPAGLNTAPTNTGLDATYGLTLAAGDVFTQVDWGFDGGTLGSIGDLVWLDLNGDGDLDGGETGLDSVTVNVIRDVNGDGAWDPDGADNVTGNGDDEKIIATTSTAGGGAYSFAGLPLSDSGDGNAADADYLIDVTDRGAVTAGLDKTSGISGVNGNSQADPYAVVLNGATSNSTADFGYAPAACSGSLGTIIWHDLDMDGDRDGGEPPIEGVTVAVWFDANGNGMIDAGIDNLLRTVATDFNGQYELKGLPFGDYLVDVTDTAGVLSGLVKTTGTPATDDNSQADPYAVTLTSGSPNDVTADFGYRDDLASSALELSGTVFIDADVDGVIDFVDGDSDGIYDPGETSLETLVQGATMLLYRVINGERFLIGRETTDVNGFYLFDDLPPGVYEVEVETAATVVDGYLQTTQTATGGVEPAVLPDTGDPEDPSTDNSANNNFGFFEGGATFTPVTLSYFVAHGDQDRLELEWQTATEVGHIGFNLWVWRDGDWRQINRNLIASSGKDSITVQKYAHQVDGISGEIFLLEDVGVRGTSRYHGPFELGKAYGRRELTAQPINWEAIRGQHETAKAERVSAARGHLKLQKADDGGTVNLLVEEDGLYRVTYQQLAAAGLDLAGVPASDIAVLNLGEATPIRVEAPGGVFGPGSFIEWLGVGLDTLYTKTNVYVLNVDPENTERIIDDGSPVSIAPAQTSYTATVHTERNLVYSFGSPTTDPWYDTSILAFTTPVSANFTFRTDGRVLGAGPASLTVSLWGVTDWARAPDHHVVLSVNGVELAEATFDGLVDYPITFDVPEAVLQDGANTLTVTVPGDTGVAFDLINVESWTVRYERALMPIDGGLEFEAVGEVFEITGLPSAEVTVYRRTGSQLARLTNVQVMGTPGAYVARFAGSEQLATYTLTSGSINSPSVTPGRPEADLGSGEAELLIISHPDFAAGLTPLVAARRAQGWSVKVVDVEDVYQQFGDGVFDPQAIRTYVNFARHNLSTRAVLLVGGDTYDYHDYLGLGGVSFIPSLYARTGDFVYFAPADGLLADGNGDDVPDVAIGRFPVRTPAELATIIDKTLNYEQLVDRKTLVMASDDYEPASRFDFALSSEQLAALVPFDWQLQRIYIDELGAGPAREQLLEAMDAGPAVTSFMGHSGPTTWSFDGLFNASDAVDLNNLGVPTVVTQWGCWTTYYVSPQNETLGHQLLLSGDRGAAAVLGATTLTEARSERALSLEIFSRLFEPGRTLGEAILEAKVALATTESPAVLDVLLGWNLLGDPTLTGFDGEVPPLPAASIFADGFESGDTSAWSTP